MNAVYKSLKILYTLCFSCYVLAGKPTHRRKRSIVLVLLGTEVHLVSSVPWAQIPGNLSQVDAGLTGDVWGINSTDQIWKLNNQGTEWTNVPGSLKHVTAGEGGLWGVDSADRIWYREGSVADSSGSSWTQISGHLKQITSGSYGVVYGVNSKDDTFCRTGITDSNPRGTGWQHIGGKLKYVSCGGLGCWGVNSGNQIFFRFGVSRQNPAGTSWAHIPGDLQQIESGPTGRVWGVNTADQVFYRAGVNQSKPTGSHWVSVAGSLKHVSVGCSGLYGVSKGGRAWRYTGSDGFSKSKCVKKGPYGGGGGGDYEPTPLQTTRYNISGGGARIKVMCEDHSGLIMCGNEARTEEEEGGLGVFTAKLVALAIASVFLAIYCVCNRHRIREHFRRQRNAVVHQDLPPTAATSVNNRAETIRAQNSRSQNSRAQNNRNRNNRTRNNRSQNSTAQNNRARNNRRQHNRARNPRDTTSTSALSPPTPPQATTKTLASSAAREFPPPPPLQLSWSVPEEPPPSYDEAMRK